MGIPKGGFKKRKKYWQISGPENANEVETGGSILFYCQHPALLFFLTLFLALQIYPYFHISAIATFRLSSFFSPSKLPRSNFRFFKTVYHYINYYWVLLQLFWLRRCILPSSLSTFRRYNIFLLLISAQHSLLCIEIQKFENENGSFYYSSEM